MKKFILITLFALMPVMSHNEQLSEVQKVSAEIARQIQCMAQNLYYEAAREPYEGKLAVAQVTMNRTRDPEFPKTVCDVVYQKTNTTYQFSWVGEKHTQAINKYEWEESMMVAKRALTEQYVHDKLYHVRAMYYHADYVHPGWRKQQVAQIGRHIFYK